MNAFLEREGYSGGKSAAELMGRLRAAPQRRAAEVELAARRAVVVGLVGALVAVVEQIAEPGDVRERSTRQWHPWAEDVYRRARERGADHPHALCILGRAWVRVLRRC
jgi:hypothetical protein